ASSQLSLATRIVSRPKGGRRFAAGRRTLAARTRHVGGADRGSNRPRSLRSGGRFRGVFLVAGASPPRPRGRRFDPAAWRKIQRLGGVLVELTGIEPATS